MTDFGFWAVSKILLGDEGRPTLGDALAGDDVDNRIFFVGNMYFFENLPLIAIGLLFKNCSLIKEKFVTCGSMVVLNAIVMVGIWLNCR